MSMQAYKSLRLRPAATICDTLVNRQTTDAQRFNLHVHKTDMYNI